MKNKVYLINLLYVVLAMVMAGALYVLGTPGLMLLLAATVGAILLSQLLKTLPSVFC